VYRISIVIYFILLYFIIFLIRLWYGIEKVSMYRSIEYVSRYGCSTSVKYRYNLGPLLRGVPLLLRLVLWMFPSALILALVSPSIFRRFRLRHEQRNWFSGTEILFVELSWQSTYSELLIAPFNFTLFCKIC
jgi:hypothetical protein